MKGIFLENKPTQWSDVSNDRILGINRLEKDEHGCNYLKLTDLEHEDQTKKSLILSFIDENTWATSDLHLNHKQRTSNNFYTEMLNEINGKVNLNDTIIFLGDMGRKDDPSQKEYINNFVRKINCSKKILCLGNHDILPISDWYSMGFSFVTDIFDATVNGIKIRFSHFPVPVQGYDINMHGHIHGEKEYWNMDWQKHIDCYIHLHDKKIYQIKDYLKFYTEGKYKGKSVKKSFK